MAYFLLSLPAEYIVSILPDVRAVGRLCNFRMPDMKWTLSMTVNDSNKQTPCMMSTNHGNNPVKMLCSETVFMICMAYVDVRSFICLQSNVKLVS